MLGLGSVSDLLEFLSRTRYSRVLRNIKEGSAFERLQLATFKFLGMESMEVYRMLSGAMQEKLYPIFSFLDLHNLLAYIRAKKHNLEDEARKLFIKAPVFTESKLMELLDIDLRDFLGAFDHYLLAGISEDMSEIEMENMLYQNWRKGFAKLRTFKELKKFVEQFLELTDAIALLKSGLDEALILSRFWKRQSLSSEQEVLSVLASRYGVAGNIVEVEEEIEKLIFKRAIRLMRAHPISAAPVLAYIFARNAESRNLRVVAYAIQEGIKAYDALRWLVYENSSGG